MSHDQATRRRLFLRVCGCPLAHGYHV